MGCWNLNVPTYSDSFMYWPLDVNNNLHVRVVIELGLWPLHLIEGLSLNCFFSTAGYKIVDGFEFEIRDRRWNQSNWV